MDSSKSRRKKIQNRSNSTQHKSPPRHRISRTTTAFHRCKDCSELVAIDLSLREIDLRCVDARLFLCIQFHCRVLAGVPRCLAGRFSIDKTHCLSGKCGRTCAVLATARHRVFLANPRKKISLSVKFYPYPANCLERLDWCGLVWLPTSPRDLRESRTRSTLERRRHPERGS